MSDSKSSKDQPDRSSGPSSVREATRRFGQGPAISHPTPHHGIMPAAKGKKGWGKKPK